MTNNYLKIITYRQRDGDPQPRLVSAFVFFDDRDEQDCALAVAHADLLADRLRKELPEFDVQVSVCRRLNSHAALPWIVEADADASSSALPERDAGLPV